MGGVGFALLASGGHELAGVSFVAASVFPDLDVFFMIFGKKYYLKAHQGPTHSLLLSPIFALLLCFPVFYYFEFSLPVLIAALAGLWIHTLLDYSNTFGIALLWPFRKKRYSLDAVFFIDLACWVLTALAYGALLPGWGYVGGIIYFVLFAVYSLLKIFLHNYVVKTTECTTAVPSCINPSEFYIMKNHNGSVETYLYNALSKKTKNREAFDPPATEHVKMAEKSNVYSKMKKITKFLHITDINEDDDKTIIIARDLAVRNFGGKFGKTTLEFNKQGDLISEMADI